MKKQNIYQKICAICPKDETCKGCKENHCPLSEPYETILKLFRELRRKELREQKRALTLKTPLAFQSHYPPKAKTYTLKEDYEIEEKLFLENEIEE